jgi:hypothetical protein
MVSSMASDAFSDYRETRRKLPPVPVLKYYLSGPEITNHKELRPLWYFEKPEERNSILQQKNRRFHIPHITLILKMSPKRGA